MHFNCSKCKKTLTEDLYFCSTKWVRGLSLFFYEHKTMLKPGKVYDKEDKIKKGLFFISPEEKAFSNYWDEDAPAELIPKKEKSIVVSENSILQGVIPSFKSGYGCCNYSMGHKLKCDCGSILGGMHLDCYESGSIAFDPEKVDRVYK